MSSFAPAMTIVRAATSMPGSLIVSGRLPSYGPAGLPPLTCRKRSACRSSGAQVWAWPAWTIIDGAVGPTRGSAIPPHGNEPSDGTIAERMPPTGVFGNRKIIVAILATSSDQLSPDLRLSATPSVNDSGGLTVKPPSRNGWACAGPAGLLKSAKKSAMVGVVPVLDG